MCPGGGDTPLTYSVSEKMGSGGQNLGVPHEVPSRMARSSSLLGVGGITMVTDTSHLHSFLMLA